MNMPFNKTKYKNISQFIEKYSKKPTKIIAVSKNHPISSVKEALEFGLRLFGENRVQEALSKYASLKQTYSDIELHLTGPLQTNKVKQAISIFDVFQTLDREKLAREFCKYSDLIENKSFFIQLNIGNEDTKSGIIVSEANNFIDYCKNDLQMNIVGLMCIPPIKENPTEYFMLLNEIANNNNLKNLSMGMSADYEVAIRCGATHIRVGTSLFGSRDI